MHIVTQTTIQNEVGLRIYHMSNDIGGTVKHCVTARRGIGIQRFYHSFHQPREIWVQNQGSLIVSQKYQNVDEAISLVITRTFLIMNATSCMTAFRWSSVLGLRMSSVSVVMNKGVLHDAMCKTADLAWGPTF